MNLYLLVCMVLAVGAVCGRYSEDVTINCKLLIQNELNKQHSLGKGRRIINIPTNSNKNQHVLCLLLLLSGDIELNPGPRAKQVSIYPCGLCDQPVTWDNQGVCCDECEVWHHKSCIELCSDDYELLQKSNVLWHCCKCDNIVCSTFTFRSFEISSTNYYEPISELESTLESIKSSDPFSPLKASSPKSRSNSTSLDHTQRTDKTRSSSMYGIQEKENLRILTVNCRSIQDKTAEFDMALQYIKPDIVCGTESWLKGIKPGKQPSKDAIKSSEIFPNNYTIYRNDRGTLGGGVFIMIHNSLISMEHPEYVTDCEIAWASIKLKGNKDMLVGSFYMPHRNATTVEQLENSLKKIDTNKFQNTIICGDFNCPDINWETLAIGKRAQDKEIQQNVIDTMNNALLTQIHEEPTRELNMLDLIFTANPSLLKASKSVPGISDHEMVVTDMDTKPHYQKQQPRKCYQYARASWEDMERETAKLSQTIIKKNNEGDSVEELWDHFKTELFSLIEKFIPSKMRSTSNRPPWMKNKDKRLLRKKNRLYKKAKKTNNWKNYNMTKKETKKALRRSEWAYINENIINGLSEKNNKPFWKYIKSKKQDNIGVAPLKNKGKIHSDSQTKAEILINQFKSVFTKRTNAETPTTKINCSQDISPLVINTNGVTKLLKDLNVAKACGPDGIPNKVLKTCAEQIAPAITTIFQKSIDTGELPTDWRNANVSSIYKKGDRHAAENYRPVSLTTVTCKILEHIICKHMLDHLENNNILTDLNHGFRAGYSCETQLLITMDDLLRTYDQNIQTDIAILDFSKAFDTVPHKLLLDKIHQYGIRGTLHTWLTNFLTKRQMRVVLEGAESSSVDVESGVPQGTVLGPLLFLCHINDLPDRVKSQVRLFADDCLLYRQIKNQDDHTTLQKDLQSLEGWASQWGMRFNAKKCYIMSVGKKSDHFYELDKHILEEVENNPYLGLQISNNLQWSNHINNIVKKASSTLGFIQRNLKHTPKESKKTAYISLVRSTLEYGCIVWDPYLKADIDRLERIQRRAARVITRDYKSRVEGCMTRMLRELELQPLQERRRNNRLQFMHKVVEGLVPAIPSEKYITFSKRKRQAKTKTFDDYIQQGEITSNISKNTKTLLTPTSKTNQYKNSFFVKTPLEWNKLSDNTVNQKTTQGFRSALSKENI